MKRTNQSASTKLPDEKTVDSMQNSDITQPDDESTMHSLAETGDKEIVHSENVCDDSRNDAELTQETEHEILNAAKDGNLETLRALIAADPQSINAVDNDGYTALHRACYSGHPDVVKELLERGANFETITKERWQPLHCACHWNFADCAALLIHAGANVNAKTKGGQTPLHLAVFQGSSESVTLLLDCVSLDPNVKNSNDETALDIARRKGPFASLFEVIEESVNVV